MKKQGKKPAPDSCFRAESMAFSLAGHDKGQLYLVLREEEQRLILCDGKTRTLTNPKRKNRIHVQKIIRFPEQLREQMQQICCDADIRRILKEYNGGRYVENRCD